MSTLESLKWTIEFLWVKAHVGIQGSELARRLAKEAAQNTGIKIEINRIPINTYYNEIADETKKKWQKNGENASRPPQRNSTSRTSRIGWT